MAIKTDEFEVVFERSMFIYFVRKFYYRCKKSTNQQKKAMNKIEVKWRLLSRNQNNRQSEYERKLPNGQQGMEN